MAKVEGRADQTLKLYDYVFDNFSDFIKSETHVGDVEKRDIRKYLAGLMDNGLKNTSVAIHCKISPKKAPALSPEAQRPYREVKTLASSPIRRKENQKTNSENQQVF
ncbi:hypothetical protein KGY64_07665 [Candidatus Bipolaricaulota bacterium]|nr:hypothetical protein [Candidatus Bipolaricaulota bacterium]